MDEEKLVQNPIEGTYDNPYVLKKEQIIWLEEKKKKILELEREIANTLGTIQDQRSKGNMVLHDGIKSKNIIGEESCTIPIGRRGIRQCVLDDIKSHVWEYIINKYPAIANSIERDGYYVDREELIDRTTIIKRKFNEVYVDYKEGALSAAFTNVRRIITGADNQYGGEYGDLPGDSLLLEKPKGGISFHEIQHDCYSYDIIREIYGDLSHKKIIESISDISVSLMQVLSLHNSKNLDSGNYLVLNELNGKIAGIPIWKAKHFGGRAPTFKWGARYNPHYGSIDGYNYRGSKCLTDFLGKDLNTVLLGDLYRNRTDSIESTFVRKGTMLLLRKKEDENDLPILQSPLEIQP